MNYEPFVVLNYTSFFMKPSLQNQKMKTLSLLTTNIDGIELIDDYFQSYQFRVPKNCIIAKWVFVFTSVLYVLGFSGLVGYLDSFVAFIYEIDNDKLHVWREKLSYDLAWFT